MRENPIAILDDDGSSLGLVCRDDGEYQLLDSAGQLVEVVNGKITIKACKEMLLQHRFSMIA